MSHLFKMDKDKNPVPCEDLMEWAQWFASSGPERQIADDTVRNLRISTVFLGMAHCSNHLSEADAPEFGAVNDVYLYETMVFGSEEDMKELDELAKASELDTTSVFAKLFGTVDFQKRYCTVEQARSGHRHAVALVKRMYEWRTMKN